MILSLSTEPDRFNLELVFIDSPKNTRPCAFFAFGELSVEEPPHVALSGTALVDVVSRVQGGGGTGGEAPCWGAGAKPLRWLPLYWHQS
jgi:hypothetical protein